MSTQPEKLHSRALVAGATGYAGRAVVERLRAEGVPTTAHVRPDSPRLSTWEGHFGALGAEVDTTPWSLAAMTAAVGRLEPTHVFALLGTTRARARRSSDAAERDHPYETVDYGLTAILLQACIDSGIRPKFVYLSALGADARAGNAYLRVRGRLEHELRDSGLSYLVFRPSFITGPDREERRRLERISAIAADAAIRALGWIGLGRFGARLRSVDAATLADSMVAMALDPRTTDRVVERDELPASGERSTPASLPPGRSGALASGSEAAPRVRPRSGV